MQAPSEQRVREKRQCKCEPGNMMTTRSSTLATPAAQMPPEHPSAVNWHCLTSRCWRTWFSKSRANCVAMARWRCSRLSRNALRSQLMHRCFMSKNPGRITRGVPWQSLKANMLQTRVHCRSPSLRQSTRHPSTLRPFDHTDSWRSSVTDTLQRSQHTVTDTHQTQHHTHISVPRHTRQDDVGPQHNHTRHRTPDCFPELKLLLTNSRSRGPFALTDRCLDRGTDVLTCSQYLPTNAKT